MLPDLTIAVDDIQLTPISPSEGDKLSVAASIHNQGASSGNIPVSIYLGNPASGGLLVSSQTIYPAMPLGSTTTVQAVIDTTGWAGQQQIYVVIDPANAIAESREDNNTIYKSVFIQSSGLTTSLVLDKAAYQANDAVTATITVTNSSGASRALNAGLFIKDTVGNVIASTASANPVTVSPNGVVAVTKTWNTGKTLAGVYTAIAEVSEDGRIVSRSVTPFAITTDKRLSAGVTVDKIAYDAKETAAVTAVIKALVPTLSLRT